MANISVRYVGIADERVITVEDLKSAGINNVSNNLVWSRANLFRVEVPGSKALEELLEAQGHFRLETPKDSGELDLLVEASHPDLEGNVLVDADTGATTPVVEPSVPPTEVAPVETAPTGVNPDKGKK